jgi:hypothetical protein
MSRKEFNVYQHDIHEYDHMTYTVTSFGKAFAHVQDCLLKKAHVINKNIDGFIKTNPNSAKGPDKGKIVHKLYCILLTTQT